MRLRVMMLFLLVALPPIRTAAADAPEVPRQPEAATSSQPGGPAGTPEAAPAPVIARPAEPPATVWYGWQILLADATVAGIWTAALLLANIGPGTPRDAGSAVLGVGLLNRNVSKVRSLFRAAPIAARREVT